MGQDKEEEDEQLKDFLKNPPELKPLSKTLRRQRATQFKFKRPGFLKDNLEGLPAGSLIEVSGEAGTGKTCFALETAAAALSKSDKRCRRFFSKFPSRIFF